MNDGAWSIGGPVWVLGDDGTKPVPHIRFLIGVITASTEAAGKTEFVTVPSSAHAELRGFIPGDGGLGGQDVAAPSGDWYWVQPGGS